MPVVRKEALLQFAVSLLHAGGAGEDEARIVAESLVQANLRGHDSHGVMRIPYYLQNVKNGTLKPGATLRIERETPSALVCDGGWGFGQVLARDLTRRLIAKAAQTGVACGSLRQAAHIGRLGEYAEIAAAENMASIICANTHGAAQRVAPVGGKRPRLGTNPICMGMPGGGQGPFILDFGTSATAEGKVRVRKIAGQPVPPGWILDCEGRPTTDPNTLYGDPPGSILPMGGDQAYKGFGLAYMIEMLCGVFSGGPCAFANSPPPVGNEALFIVLAPQQFAGVEHMLCEVGGLEKYVREVPRIDGAPEITLPGDPERRALDQRRREGIPLDDGNWSALIRLAAELNVAPPAV